VGDPVSEPRLPRVERAAIEKAMAEATPGTGTKFAVLGPNGERYSPKDIISRATGKSTREFSGGEESNRYLRRLGFTVEEI
jgi:hypothetical protein